MDVLQDFLVTTGLALIFLLLSWSWGRATGGGQPLNRFKRRFLAFGFLFALGMGYIMLLVVDLAWPRGFLFPLIGCWGVVLAGIAWYRYHRQRP